jgi:chorismate mutase/prephenate dehydratase
MDLFLDSPLKICAEICLDVRHNLLSRIELTQIKRIYSHPQAFAQCHSWLTENVPWSELFPCASTAKGVLEAIRDPEGAALGSELASQMYNLPVLVYSVQDAAWNQTRFVVVGKEESEPTKNDKTSVILFLKDRPGTLHRALEPFYRHRVNLCSIESRPTKKEAWKYMFYIDFEGHHAEPRVQKIFEELGKHSLYIKVLGSYPRDTGSLST